MSPPNGQGPPIDLIRQRRRIAKMSEGPLSAAESEQVIAEIERASGEPEFALMKYIIDGDDQAWLWPLTNEGEQPRPIRLDPKSRSKSKVMALVVGSYRRE